MGVVSPFESITQSRPVSFPDDANQYLTPSFEEMDLLSVALADIVGQSGNKYDWIVAVALSTWSHAPAFADYVGLRDRVASIRIRRTENGRFLDNAEIIQPIAVDIRGANVLLFDWLTDYGHTLDTGEDHLRQHGATNVDIATMIRKDHCHHRVDFNIIDIPKNVWVINPNARYESMKDLHAKWTSENQLPVTEIRHRFDILSIPLPLVDRFYKSSLPQL